MKHNWRKTLVLFALMLLPAVMSVAPAAGALQQLQTGMEAPDVVLGEMAGKGQRLADVKGEKLTALVFWSTWSRKSPAVLTRMQQLSQRYRDKGFRVVAINADGLTTTPQVEAQVRETVEKLKLEYPILLDKGLSAFNAFGIIALPTTIIVDPSRTITHELSGFPLEGAEVMADYLAEVLDGKVRKQVVKTGHQPDKAAMRYFNMGTTSLKSKRTADGADAWFRKAIDADPEFLLPRLALGKLYAQRGDNAQARKELEQVLAREPGNMLGLCELAMVAVDEGKVEEAKGLVDKALGAGLDASACYATGGYVYGRSGNLERALQLYDEAATMSPWDPQPSLSRARTLEENNRLPEAAAAYRRALELMMASH